MSYCLYLEPYVYHKLILDKCFFYNTLSGEKIIAILSVSEQNVIKRITFRNGTAVKLSNNEYKTIITSEWFNQLKNYYMAEIISYKDKMPFNISLERDFRKIKYNSFFRKWLRDIYLVPFINGKTERKFESIYYKNTYDINNKWKESVLLLIKKEDLASKRVFLPYHLYSEFKDSFRIYNPHALIVLYLHYSDIPSLIKSDNFMDKDVEYKIFFDDNIADNEILNANLQSLIMEKCSFDFLISSNKVLDIVLNIISNNNIRKYFLHPRITEKISDFIREQVLLKEEDIFANTISYKSIIRNKVLNSNDFGKIYLDGDNNVYSNLSLAPVCTFTGRNFKTVLKNMASKKSSWFKIRDWGKCANCFFQYLCPSPSEFEYYTNKSDLCDIEN